VAKVSSGAVKIQLDAFTLRATVLDAHWESAPSASSGDHYALAISGGAVQVALDEDAPVANHPQTERCGPARCRQRAARRRRGSRPSPLPRLISRWTRRNMPVSSRGEADAGGRGESLADGRWKAVS
jgi:hypothetical protein